MPSGLKKWPDCTLSVGPNITCITAAVRPSRTAHVCKDLLVLQLEERMAFVSVSLAEKRSRIPSANTNTLSRYGFWYVPHRGNFCVTTAFFGVRLPRCEYKTLLCTHFTG